MHQDFLKTITSIHVLNSGSFARRREGLGDSREISQGFYFCKHGYSLASQEYYNHVTAVILH